MWRPELVDHGSSLTAKLVDALARDVASGRLEGGTRLPTHRALAHELGLGIGTVTSAYALAAKRGLIEARVGSGSFVARVTRPDDEAAPIMLSHNLPPLGPSGRRLAAALTRVQRRPDLADVLSYAPPQGLLTHRQAGVEWLRRRHRFECADAERLLVTAGAQQAMALAFQVLCDPGDVVLTEAATFFGVRTLARHAGYRLTGLAMDDEGLCPGALEQAAIGGARVLYTTPTLQNPTGRTMSGQRRRDIAAVTRRYDLWIVEDDVYGAFAEAATPPPLVTFAPERTLYLTGLSKTVAPGLRIGLLLAPDENVYGRLLAIVRAESYAPPTLGALVAAHWIQDGEADAIADEIGAEIAARTALAQARLASSLDPVGEPRCPHLWLPMAELEAERLVARAARCSVQLTPAEAPIVDPTLISGVRLCVGAPHSRDQVETALERLSVILDAPTPSPDVGLI